MYSHCSNNQHHVQNAYYSPKLKLLLKSNFLEPVNSLADDEF